MFDDYSDMILEALVSGDIEDDGLELTLEEASLLAESEIMEGSHCESDDDLDDDEDLDEVDEFFMF